MKVLHLCFSDSRGGGFIGAYRLHRAMLGEGIDSRMLVVDKHTNDPAVKSFSLSKRLLNRVNRTASAAILKLQRHIDGGVHSLNIFPTGTHRLINNSDADVVQLHWVNKNMISITIPRAIFLRRTNLYIRYVNLNMENMTTILRILTIFNNKN